MSEDLYSERLLQVILKHSKGKDPRFKYSMSTSFIRMLDVCLNKEETESYVQLLLDKLYETWQQLISVPSGPQRAREVYQIANQMIEDKLKEVPPVSCQKGCSHCCHMEVVITEDEAILLSQLIKNEGISIDLSALRYQAKIQDSEAYRFIPREKRRCVLLGKDGLCQVYEQRPLSCRKYFVMSDPKQCDDINASSQVLAMNMVELLASAALNLKPLADALPRKLLSRLE